MADLTVVQKHNKIRNKNIFYRHDITAWWKTWGQSRIRLLIQLTPLKVWEMTRGHRTIFTHQTLSTDNNVNRRGGKH